MIDVPDHPDDASLVAFTLRDIAREVFRRHPHLQAESGDVVRDLGIGLERALDRLRSIHGPHKRLTGDHLRKLAPCFVPGPEGEGRT